MSLIKLSNKFGTIINLDNLEMGQSMSIEGSNPYYVLSLTFISGKTRDIRYEEYERENLVKDLGKINMWCVTK